MAIRNACFISYSRGQGQLIEQFTEQLKKALENELGNYMDETVYLDRERLSPGFNYDVSLSRALCESVCMLVIYTPKYDDSDYCIREFCAMERIERERTSKLGKIYDAQYRMIIPVILRGLDRLPENIEKIHYDHNFMEFSLTSTDLTQNVNFEPIIRKIVKVIYYIYLMIRQDTELFLNHNCNDFDIPSIDEVRNLWIKCKKPVVFPI